MEQFLGNYYNSNSNPIYDRDMRKVTKLTFTPEEDLRVKLADYFFLDNEQTHIEKENLLKFIKDHQLKKDYVYKVLSQEVAPVAGANIGYLTYPVNGIWDGFDQEELNLKIKTYLDKIKSRPSFLNLPLSYIVTRMLKKLHIHDFLNQI